MKNSSQPVANGAPYGLTPASSIPLNDHDKVLRILMLEDNMNDAGLIQMYLKSSPLNTEITLVSNKQDYIDTLKREEFDVILSDHNLPQFSSFEALRIRNEIKFHLPFILVSGTIPEEYAVTILQEGANDYILKDRPHRLVNAITEAIKKQKAIADKIVAQQELIKLHERLRLVGKATADAVWDWDLLTNEVLRGEGFEILFGYKLNEITTDLDSLTKHIHPDDKAKIIKGLDKIINSTHANWRDEYRYLKADGTYAIVMDKGIVLRDENGKAYRMVGAMQDSTHIRKLELEILEQNLHHQKQKTEIALQAQEQERKNIGKELHDNINQLMGTAKLMIDTALRSPGIHDLCLNKSYEAINLAIEEVRKLSHSMVPPSFDHHHSFVDAVNETVSNINLCSKIDIAVNIPSNGQFKIADEKIKLTFYRIIQEQLNNIIKYAGASEVTINLKVMENVYRLTVSDNGIGMDPEKASTGIGLRNIASRAELHSGNMEIISAPGEGCTLKIEIPFDRVEGSN